MATTQQLEFTQAMQDFKTMFPGMEDGIIEAVLRSNQGAVDATIDQLLAMNTDYENERLRHQLDRDDPPDVVRSAESSASASAAGGAAGGATGGASGVASGGACAIGDGSLALRDIRGWAPPLVGDLPDDFLRLTPTRCRKQVPENDWDATLQQKPQVRDAIAFSRYQPCSSSEEDISDDELAVPPEDSLPQSPPRPHSPPLPEGHSGPQTHLPPAGSLPQTMLLSQQMLQLKYAENQRLRGALGDTTADPDLDQFLEDERIALFLQNEEFMAELRRNKDFLSALVKEQGEETPPDELPYKSVYKSTLHDDDVFRERLRNMGKVSRKKFAQLARVFTGRKKRSAKQILGQGSAPSKDSLLLNSEPLLVDTEEDTDDVPAAERHRE